MRSIKFRVWDALNKKFDPQIYNAGEQFGHPSSCDWYPQQFTGLKDKNGKEIYEGDILKQDGAASHGYDGDDTIETVKWIDAIPIGHYDYSGWYTPTIYLSSWQYCEIIGNIFENPKLLTS